MQQDPKRNAPVRVLERSLAVLDCFTYEQPELALREISQKTNLAKATVHRILLSLIGGGAVVQDEATGRYQLGPKVLRWASVYSEGNSLRQNALPIMQKLAMQSGQTCNLYTLAGDSRVCIEQVPGPFYIRRHSHLGASFPLFCGASGKVLLAFLPLSRRRDYFRRMKEHPPDTRAYCTDYDEGRLLAQLDEVSAMGYCCTLRERDPYSASIAAPVFDVQGEIAATITISGPAADFTDEQVARYAALLLPAARQLSEKNGFWKEPESKEQSI